MARAASLAARRSLRDARLFSSRPLAPRPPPVPPRFTLHGIVAPSSTSQPAAPPLSSDLARAPPRLALVRAHSAFPRRSRARTGAQPVARAPRALATSTARRCARPGAGARQALEPLSVRVVVHIVELLTLYSLYSARLLLPCRPDAARIDQVDDKGGEKEVVQSGDAQVRSTAHGLNALRPWPCWSERRAVGSYTAHTHGRQLCESGKAEGRERSRGRTWRGRRRAPPFLALTASRLLDRVRLLAGIVGSKVVSSLTSAEGASPVLARRVGRGLERARRLRRAPTLLNVDVLAARRRLGRKGCGPRSQLVRRAQ